MKKVLFASLILISSRLFAQDYKEYWNDNYEQYGYKVIDDYKLFPGGEDSIKAFVYRNIQYTPSAIASKREGYVNLKATYKKNTGKIISVELKQSLEYDRHNVFNLDDIAKRIVLSMPNLITDAHNQNQCEECIGETNFRIKFKYEPWMPIDSSFIYERIQDSINVVKYKEEQILKAQQEKEEQAKKEEENRREYEAICIKKFGKSIGIIIAKGDVRIGMTKEMCEYAWGSPNRVSQTQLGSTLYETWLYDNLNTLRFKAGKLYSFQK